ncbi:hypothetical protein PMAYCL1PPCAC_09201, partial [Pristionchus mayeri]
YFARICNQFVGNAFYSPTNAITILAPFLFKELVSSDLIHEPLLSHAIIAHELFHSMFTSASSTLIDVYGKRGECLKDHYSKTCSSFGKGRCARHGFTIYEDGADAEGWRLLYDLFEKDHSDQLDQPMGVNGITLHQAYFYFTSISWCQDKRVGHRVEDKHSSGHVRVNGVVSLMPEFSRAFKCKKEDRMYTEEKKCQIF